MPPESVNILLVDRDDQLSRHLRPRLARSRRPTFVLDRVDNLAEIPASTPFEPYHVCLINLDAFPSMKTNGLDRLRALAAQLPTVLLANRLEGSVAESLRQVGCVDCLKKTQLTSTRLKDIIHGALDDRTENLEWPVKDALPSTPADPGSATASGNRRKTNPPLSVDDPGSMLDLLPCGVALIDTNGRLVFLNTTWRRLICQKDHDPIGQPWIKSCGLERHDGHPLTIPHPNHPHVCIPVRLRTHPKQCLSAQLEIHHHPHDPQRKILLLVNINPSTLASPHSHPAVDLGELIGLTESMRRVFHQIGDVARIDSTVLIEGETGTGKELVAQAIHASGLRRNRPFVPVNCAGLTESLVESHLFGHRRGAFTGAVADQPGVFETADHGTIFLDELGDIPLGVQKSLLRVLQEKEIVRIGESKPRKVDVRIITATHRNLEKEVREGRFREDLLYRIRVARIVIPPLREREEDIPLLVDVFLKQMRTRTGKTISGLTRNAMRLIIAHHWPGNVRELQSALEYATIRCRVDKIIRSRDLPPEIVQANRSTWGFDRTQGDERDRLLAALTSAGEIAPGPPASWA